MAEMEKTEYEINQLSDILDDLNLKKGKPMSLV